jgi:hypothetical protein
MCTRCGGTLYEEVAHRCSERNPAFVPIYASSDDLARMIRRRFWKCEAHPEPDDECPECKIVKASDESLIELVRRTKRDE